MKKNTSKNQYKGVEGWLALFTGGQILSIIYSVFYFFYYSSLSPTEIEAFNEYDAGLGDTLQAVLAVENMLVIGIILLQAYLVYAILKKRKIAKKLAIISMALIFIFGLIDYIVVYNLFSNYGLLNPEIQSVVSQYAGDVGRSFIVASIWIPYFIKSKRVKATLVG